MIRKFNLEIHNRFMQGKDIAYELPATLSGFRHWVGILHLKHHPLNPMDRDADYVVVDFELSIDKMDEYFANDDIVNMQRTYHRSQDELYRYLEEKGYDFASFTYPWKCDFPL